MAIAAAQVRAPTGGQPGHAVAVAADHPRLGVDIGAHLQIVLAAVARPPLVALGIFPGGEAVIVGPHIVAAMAGVAVLLFRAGDVVTVQPVAVETVAHMAGSTVLGVKVGIGPSPGARDERPLGPARRHRPMQHAEGALVALLTAQGHPRGSQFGGALRRSAAVTVGADQGGVNAPGGLPVAKPAGLLSGRRRRDAQQEQGEKGNDRGHDNRVPSDRWGLSARNGRPGTG